MADNGEWVVETVSERAGFRTVLRAENGVRVLDSAQDLGVFENLTFGRVMVLDGAYQITTADEFIYHEMMAHVPLYAHGAVREVLIIGGGDGGVAREVLRHDVARVRLVEIDRAVVDLAVAEFPDVAAGAFEDPRLDLVIDDGVRHVATTTDRFDVVIVDSPDPIGAGAVLFGEAFYRDCRRVLRPGGALVTQSGMPFLTPDWMRGHAGTLRGVFGDVAFFLTTVPSYTGGPLAHGLSSDGDALRRVSLETLTARHREHPLTMRYWSPEVHRAAFALPPYVAAALG
ncbi:polyamine aminopropyltransferase [Acuticoccus mangrovi]|uniref:Polyamine aminopropyltransferase n=1 Tax=Acuticoccus mangrovi TaxID=2796142 RepID=A0A934ISY5_9HYPH|nr:polyamine aminopropyltransferase [Acuticoccus mangrovi]MBJ3777450.1 polyamine aminopropyltransferase [Acuticoccus mangrovi]